MLIEQRLTELMSRPMTFKDLMIAMGDEYGAQSIWDGLRNLQQKRIIESVRISAKKSGWKLQYHVNEKRP